MTQPSPTYRAWKKMSPFPGGSWAFSAAAMARVPYFASILPHVVRMEPGLAEVTVPKWFYVKNTTAYHSCRLGFDRADRHLRPYLVGEGRD